MIASGRPPSFGAALWALSAVVAGAALGVALVVSRLAVAVWILAAWAVLAVFLGHRLIELWVRHPELRRARRQLQAEGNLELLSMVGETADGLVEVVVDCCVEADIKGHGLFIQIDEGYVMAAHWADLGFSTERTAAMPWGEVRLIVRRWDARRRPHILSPEPQA